MAERPSYFSGKGHQEGAGENWRGLAARRSSGGKDEHSGQGEAYLATLKLVQG
jgi:hypothetical protein